MRYLFILDFGIVVDFFLLLLWIINWLIFFVFLIISCFKKVKCVLLNVLFKFWIVYVDF